MATTYSNEATLYLNTTPPTKADGNTVGGRLRRYRATITLAAQASGSDIILHDIPSGSTFAYGILSTTVTLGSAKIAIGITGTTGKHRAAAVLTALAPELFGLHAAIGETALTAEERVRITTSVAALPASGTLTVDLYYTNG